MLWERKKGEKGGERLRRVVTVKGRARLLVWALELCL